MENLLQSGGTIPVKSSRACVVYDARNGHVHHIHQVVTFEGGHEPNESLIEAHAIELAERRMPRAAKLKALHVASDKVHPHQFYAVNLKTHSLVTKQKVEPRKKKK